ncbi:type II CRISPR-associated endonuclease Cas1 [Companilactobacillus sp. DQM5]|uniref:type II CRISPR-associated endonuclease Cas1 n=1 Tax=Companilactobacillus sp. DQM5 TaxID=3463359 RepID=UPI004059C879
MGWRMVHIKEGDLLKVRLDNLEIHKLDNKVYIPLSDINMVVLEGNKTTVTTKLLTRFSENNIGLVICDDRYLPAGIYLPYGQYHHMSKRVIEQSNWTQKQRDVIWKSVITQKVNNQITFAQMLGVEQDRLELMRRLANEIVDGDKTNREGHIAKVYFDSLYGNSFTRDQDILENYAMNFGYAIIRSCMARTVIGNGLITMLGIFHKNEFNSFNLADDLMEPFRPLMDYWIHKVVMDKNDYLSYESRLNIIEFMNQKLEVNGKKMTIDNAMQEFVKSFLASMENENTELLLKIDLKKFIGD